MPSSLRPSRLCGSISAVFCALAVSVSAHSAWADLSISHAGTPKCTIVQQLEATEAEKHAAAELKLHLDAITGASIPILLEANTAPKNSIIIGQGRIASTLFPKLDLKRFGPEEYVIRCTNGFLLLTGGQPRGTIYAVNRFLQDQCGVRWWTPWATNMPRRPSLKVSNLNLRGQPAFEYRGDYWFSAFDPLWKTRNGGNNESHVIPAALGGCIQYKGFCHTFYPLVPPDKYFAEHPDWYSMVNGKRTHNRAQLCLTNPRLREFVVQRVKEWLRECPDCKIISVTQNDWDGHCECPDCKALDDAEGSQAGTMITFANYVAEHIEQEFPNVAVDTFAYQYTRKPPKTVRPHKNVTVRLCSIECNFREPLDSASNAAFAADITKWAEICPRLYIWDYVTDFSHYIHPHPNWFVLGPNMRFFQAHSVKGVFEEGAYAGYGAEMMEMRAWVLAQLLWSPQQDDRKLIREFLDGYFGTASAKFIYDYLELIHRESQGSFVACYLRKDPPPYLNFKALSQAEGLWQKAEGAARTTKNQDCFTRVRMAHLPVRLAFLKDWKRLRLDCWEQNLSWPINESRKAVAEQFRDTCKGVPGKDWTQVHTLSERGLQVDTFLKPFEVDPALNVQTPAAPRLPHPAPPTDLASALIKRCVDLQDNTAALYKRGEFAEVLPDISASDHRAVRMPGNHSEWAFRIGGKEIMARHPAAHCKVYVVARVEKTGTNPNPAFVAGVYDNDKKDYPAQSKITFPEATENYRSCLIGSFDPSLSRDIFVAPASNVAVKAVWVDRVYLVPEP